METQEPADPRVVIIGAGFGGLEAAKYLGNKPVRVTVIDRTNYHLFQPLLYQVATAALSPADIAAPIRGVLSKYENIEVFLAEVRAVEAVVAVEPRADAVAGAGVRGGLFGCAARHLLHPLPAGEPLRL